MTYFCLKNRKLFKYIAWLFLITLPAKAYAHGGVVLEEDICVIKIEVFSAHFKIYQPQTSQHQEFCEDIPSTDETVFVMEYEHSSLSETYIEFRIINDVTGLGRFAKLEDVNKIQNLESATVFHQSPKKDPDIFTAIHSFNKAGWYIGIVTANHPGTNKTYTATFPFEVGFSGFGYLPLFISLILLLQIYYLFTTGQLARWIDTWNSQK
ncbi:MAG: hypothetical protein CMD52_07730 [Gammaproteobacteria bacterium]|nr:hypothetical protein [Gammaproteobacteria bacterium]